MAVHLISANPLFREILAEPLSQAGMRLVRTPPERCRELIRRERPPVVIVDSALSPGLVLELLDCTRSVPSCRIILLDASCNDMVVVDLRRTALSQVADLVMSVRDGMAGAPAPVPLDHPGLPAQDGPRADEGTQSD